MIVLNKSWAWTALVGLTMVTVACSDDDTKDSDAPMNGPTGSICPDDSALTHENFGEEFFTSYCTGCHSSDNSGADRNGAPEGRDWDTVENIRAAAAFIDMRTAAGPDATNTSMPPAAGPNQPTDAEREQLGEWLACDAP